MDDSQPDVDRSSAAGVTSAGRVPNASSRWSAGRRPHDRSTTARTQRRRVCTEPRRAAESADRRTGRTARRTADEGQPGAEEPSESRACRDEPSKHELVHPQGAEQPRGFDSRGLAAPGGDRRAGPILRRRHRADRNGLRIQGRQETGRQAEALSRLSRRPHGDQRRTWFLVRETPGIGDFTGRPASPADAAPRSRRGSSPSRKKKSDEGPEAEDRLQARATA